eukprot:TRINITY_DN2094_c0_g1_i1.p1 TRINITY_DN2094_c0_g1~~TRINITY_DN2094_c0_g1_i1.p1  ORF type:complete len:297 (-),score=91.29 TRINITY_DN2094_c0_g1_i1:214-1071(-)
MAKGKIQAIEWEDVGWLPPSEDDERPNRQRRRKKFGKYGDSIGAEVESLPSASSLRHLYDVRTTVDKWMDDPTFWGMISEDMTAPDSQKSRNLPAEEVGGRDNQPEEGLAGEGGEKEGERLAASVAAVDEDKPESGGGLEVEADAVTEGEEDGEVIYLDADEIEGIEQVMEGEGEGELSVEDGPELRWETRLVLGPGGNAWHPANRKVKMSVYVRELRLSPLARERLLVLVGRRYNATKDELTLVSERFRYREENRKDVLRQLVELIHEACRADELASATYAAAS